MTKFICTRCNWEGAEKDLIQIPICPSCSVGHSPLWRLLKKGDDLECPNCSFRDNFGSVPKEPECPECHNEYLKKIDQV